MAIVKDAERVRKKQNVSIIQSIQRIDNLTRQAKLEKIARIIIDYPLLDMDGSGICVADLARKILNALER